ncbi:Asparagine--tRNA ligase, mitochondrial [Pseudocercospora fuligena]|uniref:asparagine--tRNA ligase n=1 Tax=Pseudocercospora fuligena TaxID=685502 RepID=A0A8H6VMS0_9PEZI|nr:Asparagine--tRNA ligase, mitochondrial [Pseudocercospora fuligena]
MKVWRPASCVARSYEAASRRHFTTSRALLRQATIADVLRSNAQQDDIEVNGWVRSVRKQKRTAFIHLGDGSTTEPLQAVLKPEQAADLSYGTAISLKGLWQASTGGKQSHELQVSRIRVLGENNAESSPLQPKYQTAEYLRTIPHLRPRIPTNALLLRLRSQVIATITRFFNEEGFVQTHTPIITSSDCEGAGEVFTVSSNASRDSEQKSKLESEAQVEHFFRSPKYLTVSAQLHLEALAQAVEKVWTLSPTFRAEHSDTPRHLSEFYMLEAELCFVEDMASVMDLVERMLRTVAINLTLSSLGRELAQSKHWLDMPAIEDAQRSSDQDLLQKRWKGMAAEHWPRITYHDAVEHLQKAASESKITFVFTPTIEDGLQAEHERYLAQSIGQGKPVFVTDYPIDQKPFYMPPSSTTINSRGTSETAACFDLLVPDLCELVGGSMREHRSKDLLAAMQKKGVAGENLEWYQDLRKYGGVPHGGFGLGFDRLLCYLGGVGSIRDIVAFPRWYGRCDC